MGLNVSLLKWTLGSCRSFLALSKANRGFWDKKRLLVKDVTRTSKILEHTGYQNSIVPLLYTQRKFSNEKSSTVWPWNVHVWNGLILVTKKMVCHLFGAVHFTDQYQITVFKFQNFNAIWIKKHIWKCLPQHIGHSVRESVSLDIGQLVYWLLECIWSLVSRITLTK